MKNFFKIILITVATLIIILLVKTFTLKKTAVSTPPIITININTEQAIQQLAKMIQFKTISYQESEKFNAESFNKMHSYLESTFPLVYQKLTHETVNGFSLLFKWQGKQPALKPILLLAHQDVVPVSIETLNAWKQPPFAGIVDSKYIWGRGTLDDKASLTGILAATTFLLEDGFVPERTIYLAFGHDEEIGGAEGAKKIAELLKSRNVELEYVLDEGGVISDGLIPGLDKKVAMIGIAEKGNTSLKLTVKAAGGHSSMPPKHTAIGVMSQAIVNLENNPFPSHAKYSMKFFKILAPYMPFTTKLIFANSWILKPFIEQQLDQNPRTSAMIRTTTAATIFKSGEKDNILPTTAEAIVNFRIIPGDTVKSVLKYVNTTINNADVAVTAIRNGQNPSKVSPINNSSYQQIAQTIRQVNGDDIIVAPYLVMAGTDSRKFEIVSENIYRFLFNETTPEDLKRYHNINERISIKNYIKVIRFYYQLMKNSNTLQN